MSSAELYVVPVYDILILLPKSVRKHRSAGRSGMGCLGSLDSAHQVDSWASRVCQKHLLGSHCEPSAGTGTLEGLHLADTGAFPCVVESNRVSWNW